MATELQPHEMPPQCRDCEMRPPFRAETVPQLMSFRNEDFVITSERTACDGCGIHFLSDAQIDAQWACLLEAWRVRHAT